MKNRAADQALATIGGRIDVPEDIKQLNGELEIISESVQPRFSLERTFASLKYRNYRLWFIGQLASLVGTWMQTTAQGYLVYELTKSPAYLGYVGFAGGVPSWFFMLYGGVISDRMSRRLLMIITQTAMMVLAFILAALTFTSVVQPWHIIVLAFGLGVANAFDAPARQAFVLEMVDRKDMANAIALNSMMFNSATAVGPAIAGIAYALVGPGWCFTINGISFIAVIIALMLMDIKPMPQRARSTSTIHDLREGMQYVAHHVEIRSLIFIALLVSTFGLGYAVLIPAWAVKVLGGDATTAGLMQSARGVGSLIGAFMIAALGRFRFKGKLLTVGTFVFPIFILLFTASRNVPLSLLLLVGVGLGSMIIFNMLNTLIQMLVSDQVRGRVLGIYSLTFFGSAPIGSLLTGGVADAIGEPITVLSTALITFACAVYYFARLPQLRKLE